MVKLLGESILDLKYYYWTDAEIAGVPGRRHAHRLDVRGRLRGLHRPTPSKGNEVYEAIMKAGEEFNIKPTGPSDIRRIEGAIFNWGADMTYDNNPIEMGLDRLVDWDTLTDEACISLAALKTIRDAGVGRKIVGVEIDGEPFPALNNVKWPVTSDGAEVGKVTSAIYSPRLEKNIGYAWLPTRATRTRARRRRVETEWGDRNARVVEMPFVDPKKTIPVS